MRTMQVSITGPGTHHVLSRARPDRPSCLVVQPRDVGLCSIAVYSFRDEADFDVDGDNGDDDDDDCGDDGEGHYDDEDGVF